MGQSFTGVHREQERRRRTGRTSSDAPPANGSTLALQQSAGNQAVAAMIEGGQAKLSVGRADDPLEREADDVAAQVVDAIRSGTVTAATGEGTADRRLQRRPSAPAAGPDGGPLDQATEAAIGPSGGRALQRSSREPLEQAFGGADFTGVRVHDGPAATDLNDRVGADAFTVGADIYFRDRVPAATDPLLAHELTHVIQQGRATASEQVSRTHAPDRLQRFKSPFKRKKSAPTATPATPAPTAIPATPAPTATPVASTAANAVKVPRMTAAYELKGDTVESRSSTTVIRAGTQITVEYARSARRRGLDDDATAAPTFVPIMSGTAATGEDLAGRYIRLDAIDGTAAKSGTATTDKVIGALGTGGDMYGTVGNVGDHIGDLSKKPGASAELGTHADNLGYAAGAGDMAGMFVTLAGAIRTFKDTDADNWDKTEAGLDTVQALGSGAGGIASTIDTATDSAGKSAEAAGGLGMFTGIFDGIKATFKTVKKAVELANDAKKHQKTNQEKFHDVMEIVSGLMEAAKSGIETAKTFLDTFASGPSAALTNSVPGFGIAIGAADLIVRSVDLVYAKIHSSQMRSDKRKLKLVLGGVKGKSSKDQADAIIADVDARRGKGDVISQADEEAYSTASEYLLAKGVQYVNDKRVNRALLKMSVAMTKISGDVATLGGASAPVGIGLKAGAMALDVGASVFRTFKQWARDKKAAKEAKSGTAVTTGFFSLFDSSKSSAAKWKKYNRMVDKIFDMIVAAANLPAPDPDTRFKGIDRYVRAIGIAPAKMHALRNDPGKLRLEMITALKKRE